jgi:hypothetical protein
MGKNDGQRCKSSHKRNTSSCIAGGDKNMEYNYETIKELARLSSCKVTDLIALSRNNDPFYCGTEGDRQSASWFGKLWEKFGYNYGVHLRRVHYQIVSFWDICLPNGKPYENTEQCWDYLASAASAARYLGIVDPASFVDRRNPKPVIPDFSRSIPSIEVYGHSEFSFESELPSFPSTPRYCLTGYQQVQPYSIEIWCEKSTMNDVLVPLCKQYDLTFVTGLGELSITATLQAVERIREQNRPARIFYVSDFDPAGACMPVSVSRKIEYFLRNNYPDLDVKLFPIVLTLDQVKNYQLPKTPIKETEKRKDSFEKQYGTGAVELDALEALYPGELRKIVWSHVQNYYDQALNSRVWQAEHSLEKELADIQEGIINPYLEELEELEELHTELCHQFEKEANSILQRTQDIHSRIAHSLQMAMPSIADYPVPQGDIITNESIPLFDSNRSYESQIAAYKKHQGKEL